MNTTDFLNYCKSNIEDFSPRMKRAWKKIGQYRCPLSYADYELFSDMQDALEDYCEDNELNSEDYDIEEIIWED